MNCDRVEELLIDYLEAVIEPQDKELVLKHLDSCGNCSKKYSEFHEIRAAFQSQSLPEPSKELLDSLTAKAKQDLSKEKTPFWKKWFYSPILIPAMTTALVIMVWVDYKDSIKHSFDDRTGFYSGKVMAKKLPSQIMMQEFDIDKQDFENEAKAPKPSIKLKEEQGASSRAVIQDSLNKEKSDLARSNTETVSLADNYKFLGSDKRGDDLKSEKKIFKRGSTRVTSEDRQSVYGKRVVEYTNIGKVSDSSSKLERFAKSNKDINDSLLLRREPVVPSESSEVQEESIQGDIPLDSYNYRSTEQVSSKDKVITENQTRSSEFRAHSQFTVEQGHKKLEEEKFKKVESPEFVLNKKYLSELNFALRQQKAGDCDSAILTNENLLKNDPAPPDTIKEQTFLSLAQCYEQQNNFEQAIKNYDSLQQVSSAQKVFATKKIQELNHRIKDSKRIENNPEPFSSEEAEITK